MGCEDEHHDHSHDAPPIETNASESLYSYVDTTKIRCLNVVAAGLQAGSSVYEAFWKPQDNRYECGTFVQSDADCQMVIHIPFIGNCKVYSIILRTNVDDAGHSLSSPKVIKIFKNFKKNVDFDSLNDSKEDYKIEHPRSVGLQTAEGTNNDDSTFVEHELPRRGFQNCSSLTLFFQDNWLQDEDYLCRMYYLEIRGEFSGYLPNRNAVPLMTVYESAPNPLDHTKLESENTGFQVGQ